MEKNKKFNAITGPSVKDVIKQANELGVTLDEFTTLTQTRDGGTYILIYYK